MERKGESGQARGPLPWRCHLKPLPEEASQGRREGTGMRGWSLGQGTRQRYLSVRRQECSLPETPSYLGLTSLGILLLCQCLRDPCVLVPQSGDPSVWEEAFGLGSFLGLLSVPCGPPVGFSPKDPFLEFHQPQRVMGLFVSKACLCKDLGLHPPALHPPTHTHTLAALPSREAGVWQMPSCGQGWLSLDRTRLSVAPLASPLGGSWAECGAQDPRALPALVSQKRQSGVGTGTHSQRQSWRVARGVTAGAMPTHSPFSSPPPPLCEDCCWISQSHFLNPSLSQVQGRDLGAQGGKKCSPGSLQG